MTEKKQLVLAVEGSTALGSYWSTIFSDYLEKVIRSFCGNEAAKTASRDVELALVTFNSHGPFSSCLGNQSNWTRNVDYFLELLSAMHFSGDVDYGFCDTAIAEGLSQVLMMFPSPNDSQTEALQRHCILVSASNPYSLPTAVYLPLKNNPTQSQICLSDAETVAKSFPQSCISLSVICPRQLPKLRAIYNAGKKDLSAADPTIDIVKNPHFLVLISENFKEGVAALSPTGTAVTSIPPVSEPPATSVSTASESQLNNESVSVATLAGTAHNRTNLNQDMMKKRSPETVTMMPPLPSMPHEQVQSQSLNSTYVNKVWEGKLSCLQGDQHIFISGLECEGYQSLTSSKLLTEDWPTTMLIDRIIPKDFMTDNRHFDKADMLVFRSIDQHALLKNCQEKKLILVMGVSPDQPCRLIGMLFSKDIVVFEPQISEQNQPATQQQQQQRQVSSSGPKA